MFKFHTDSSLASIPIQDMTDQPQMRYSSRCRQRNREVKLNQVKKGTLKIAALFHSEKSILIINVMY